MKADCPNVYFYLVDEMIVCIFMYVVQCQQTLEGVLVKCSVSLLTST